MLNSIQQFIYHTFSILNKSKINYCIQNNYEELPYHLESDIDIFISNISEYELDRINKLISQKTGFKIVQKFQWVYDIHIYLLILILMNCQLFNLIIILIILLLDIGMYDPKTMLKNRRIYNNFLCSKTG